MHTNQKRDEYSMSRQHPSSARTSNNIIDYTCNFLRNEIPLILKCSAQASEPEYIEDRASNHMKQNGYQPNVIQ